MKAKLMTIFAILAVMMTIVGCKPDSITEEEEQKVVDEVTIDLTRNDWKSVKVTERIYDGKSYTYTTVNTLCFKNSMVTYNIEESSNYTDDIYTLQREGSYTVSKDGKTVTIIIGKNIYTLNYSKEKLTGFWSSNYLEFLTIQCMN